MTLPFAFRLERAQSRARMRVSVLRLEVSSARQRLRFLERRRDELVLPPDGLVRLERMALEARMTLASAERRLARLLALREAMARLSPRDSAVVRTERASRHR